MPHRFALLVASAVAAAPAFAQLPAPAAEGKGPTVIDAERMDGVGEVEMTARGSAQITQDDLTIFGEFLKYNRELGWVDAHDGVRLQLGVDRFFGPKLRYNMLDDTGVFEQPQYLLRRQNTARGQAESIEFRGPDRYRLKKATYTTCEPGDDDWRVEAEELDLDYESSEGRARKPRLRFFDRTILAAPFAFFPLDNSRKSGLLAPYYSQSSTRGFEAGLPYYWNIAPERDLTLTPIYMTKRGLMLKSHGRYIDRRDFNGELKVEYMPGDLEIKRDRYGIAWQHRQGPLPAYPGLNLTIDYNRVSDHRYFVDLATQVTQSSIGNLNQEIVASYSGGLGPASYGAMARVQKFQTLQDPLAPITPPYHRVPHLAFTPTLNDVAGLMDTTLPMEYVRFSHPSFVEGSRITANPTVAAPFLAPGWFFTPRAGVRSVAYGLQNTAAGATTSPKVSVPWMSLDSGLIFDREARFFGETLTQTLEPRLFYVNVPYRYQDDIPVFDTGLADFSFPQLFTENRFGGGDRFGDANHLTATMTTRFLQNAGQEVFRATIGQRYYFADERVALPGAPLRTASTSDWLASIGGRLFHHWTFDATTQYNPRLDRAERYTVAAKYSPEVAKVVSASYRYNRNTLRQIDVAGQWPIAAGWYAVGRYNYSMFDKRLLEGLAGVEYNAGCWVFRAVMQRIQAAAQVTSTGFFFQLVFNGVGELGSDETVNLLKRGVPGYMVTNPSDPTLVPSAARRQLPFKQIY